MKLPKVNSETKGLIFDLDGTLADTMPIHFSAYKNILSGYGIDYAHDVFMSLAGMPAVQTIEKLNEMYGTAMNPKEVGYLKEAEYEKMMHKMKPIEPLAHLVRQYYGKLPMSIGTGGYRDLAQKTIEIIGLADYFDILVSADDVKQAKPHPETFLRCAKQMGVEPKFCQVFEDGELGIQAAQSAGMMATLITDFYEPKTHTSI